MVNDIDCFLIKVHERWCALCLNETSQFFHVDLIYGIHKNIRVHTGKIGKTLVKVFVQNYFDIIGN